LHFISLYSILTYRSYTELLLHKPSCAHTRDATVKREVKPERIERMTVAATAVKPKPEMSAEPEVMDLCYSSDEETVAAANAKVKKNSNSDSEDEYGACYCTLPISYILLNNCQV
jgi:hypothetical protein